jgi:hypothetical protein
MARRHEIPTHLDVEDKAFYGLSVRQVTHLMVGASTAYAVWNQWIWAPPAARLALAILCFLAAAALALVRPGGRGLEQWAFVVLHHAATPRRSVWRVPDPNPDDWRARGGDWAELAPRVAWRGDGR